MKKFAALTFVALIALSLVVVDASAGRVNGPGRDSAICPAFSSVTYHETFYGNELAVVSIVGDGDTDLDIFVYDPAGRLVARGIGTTDRETVSFMPPVTGTYRIVVRNLGNVWNRFSLATN